MDRKLGKRISYLMNHHHSYVNDKLKVLGLTYAQANVLLQLKVPAFLNQDELGRRLLLDKARISRLVKQLEEKGYISKKQSKSDGRAFDIAISEKGRAVITDIMDVFNESSEHMLKGIDSEEVELLLSLLDHICINLSKEGEYHNE